MIFISKGVDTGNADAFKLMNEIVAGCCFSTAMAEFPDQALGQYARHRRCNQVCRHSQIQEPGDDGDAVIGM